MLLRRLTTKKEIADKGFTIVELLITIVVGAVLIGITSLIVANQSHISQLGRDVTISNSFAEGKIEALRSAGFNNLVSAPPIDITTTLPAELKAPRNASLMISDHSAGIKQIDLIITYNDQGTPRTYNYKTFVGELGVGQN